MPPPLTKTDWATDNDYSFADITSVATWCKSTLWAIKAAFMRQILNTNCVAGSAWTCYYSCDSVTAGTANDGVDRWTSSYDATKIVRASAGAHSWFVLKSPSGINSVGPFYLIIDYNTSTDYNCTFVVSKAAPTGGSTSARPTATDEAVFSVTQFQDSTTQAASKIHKTVDSVGNITLIWGKTGAGKPTISFGFQTLTDTVSGDTWPVIAFLDYGSAPNPPFHPNQNSWSNSSTPAMRTRNYAGTAAVNCSALCYRYNNAAGTDFLTGLMGAQGADQADGKWIDMEVPIAVITSAHYSRKGILPDFRWGVGGGAGHSQGVVFTNGGVVTHIFIGGTWVPWKSQPSF